MDNQSLIVAAITLIAGLAAYFLLIFLLSGGSISRIRLAMRCEWRALRDPSFRQRVEPLLATPGQEPQKPKKPSGAPLRLLALLQREGRLVDFLLEDIQSYGDTDVGAAVRDIHRKCQTTLKEHLVLEPVVNQPEQATVDIPPGFDPSAVRLTGNVTGQPPFRGTLQHHGWRVKELKLGPPPEGQDEFILMPAEVELPGSSAESCGRRHSSDTISKGEAKTHEE
jgi:hypothetical protein